MDIVTCEKCKYKGFKITVKRVTGWYVVIEDKDGCIIDHDYARTSFDGIEEGISSAKQSLDSLIKMGLKNGS